MPRDPYPSIVGLVPGQTGIPTSRLPSIASGFANNGVIYVVRLPSSAAIRPVPWPHLKQEQEWIVLSRVPSGSIMRVMPARKIGPLTVDGDGRLVPGLSR